MKICIASPDIVGPIRNGGVGTACTALAQFLASEGHDVTLFYTSTYFENGTRAQWEAFYRGYGVTLLYLEADSRPPVHRTPGIQDEDNIARSYHVYRQLRDTDFDLIHFVDYIGAGYFTALARSQGLCLANTLLAVTTHSPTLWSRIANLAPVDDLSHMVRDRMERRLIELCDLVLSPSHYMLDWLSENGFVLPARRHVIPNLMPRRQDAVMRPAASAPVREIVFFGRIEPRKGLLLFCDAIDRIRDRLPADVTITFLGKTGGAYPADLVQARGQRWQRPVQILSDLDTFQANDYLAQPGRLAVLAALTDNSPYTVLECLSHRVPFISSDVGGIAELIATESQAETLFAPTPAGLATRLLAVLAKPGVQPAQPAPAIAQAEQDFRDLHNALGKEVAERRRQPAQPSRRKPMVSVIVLHFERPVELAQAIAGLDQQDYPRMEVIVVDNGSRSPEARASLDALEAEGRPNLRVMRMPENLYEPAARNAGAAAAAGEYLLFMDDDNVPKPQEVETFVRAAQQGGADLLTCFNDQFSTPAPPAMAEEALKRFVVFGDFGPLGLILNSYGDLNCFVRRDRFLAIGGFVVDGRFNHAEDWRFFAKAWSRGLKMDVVPEALIWYRTGEGGWGDGWRKRDRSGAMARAAEVYLEVAPPEVKPFLRLAQGLFWKGVELEGARRNLGQELAQARQDRSGLAARNHQLEVENEALRQTLARIDPLLAQVEEALPDDPRLQRGLRFVRELNERYMRYRKD
ncbi:glycosyltransferase [Roseomonas sp. F4]